MHDLYARVRVDIIIHNKNIFMAKKVAKKAVKKAKKAVKKTAKKAAKKRR